MSRFDPERERRDWLEMRRRSIESGLGLRHHLSQGARLAIPTRSWCFDDGLGRTAEDRNRWLYTAITRAEMGSGDPVMNNDVSNQARKTSEEVRHV